MASVSFGINRNTPMNPDNFTVGTLAVTTNDLELRIDATKGFTTQELYDALEQMQNVIMDGRTTRIGGAV